MVEGETGRIFKRGLGVSRVDYIKSLGDAFVTGTGFRRVQFENGVAVHLRPDSRKVERKIESPHVWINTEQSEVYVIPTPKGNVKLNLTPNAIVHVHSDTGALIRRGRAASFPKEDKKI